MRDARRCAACGLRFSPDAAFCPFDGSRLVLGSFGPFADPLLGTTIDGRYEPVEMIGDGGMGRVYKVRHVSLERTFAMKVLRRELAADDELAKRFVREAKATAAIKHPNIVQITDFGMLPSSIPYFVMELLVGRTLRNVLRTGPLARAQALPVLSQLASGLDAAHRAGVIHRDLKPENVFLMEPTELDANGDAPTHGSPKGGGDFTGFESPPSAPCVRLVDFGASKIVGVSRMTREGIVFGTPHYMSPEQAAGQEVDHRADVYSFGVIMYETLAGRRPFDSDSYMGVLRQHLFDEPVPPSQLNPQVGDLGSLEAIVLRCLAKAPENRFESMTDVLRALDHASQAGPLDGPARGVKAVRVGWAEATTAARPLPSDGADSARHLGSSFPLRPIRSTGLAVLVALGLGAPIAWAILGRLGAHRATSPGPSSAAAVPAALAAAGLGPARSVPPIPPEALASRPSSLALAPPLGSQPGETPLPQGVSSTGSAAGRASAAPSAGAPPASASAAGSRGPHSRRRKDSSVPFGPRAATVPDDIGDPFAGHR